MTHYHVGSNTPGYLPEGDVYIVRTKRDARYTLAEEVRRYRDSEADLPRSQRRTVTGRARDGYLWAGRKNDRYDLGIAFWGTACQETDCAPDSE